MYQPFEEAGSYTVELQSVISGLRAGNEHTATNYISTYKAIRLVLRL